MRYCLFHSDAFKGLENGRAMPRITLKRFPQLRVQPI
jgi:hypothetical protein